MVVGRRTGVRRGPDAGDGILDEIGTPAAVQTAACIVLGLVEVEAPGAVGNRVLVGRSKRRRARGGALVDGAGQHVKETSRVRGRTATCWTVRGKNGGDRIARQRRAILEGGVLRAKRRAVVHE